MCYVDCMSAVYPYDRENDEINRIREVVSRHRLPDMVTGFDIRLGDFDGDPAMWIEFKLREDIKGRISENMPKLAALEALRKVVQDDLFGEFHERYPYFRFKVDHAGATGH